MKSPFVEVKRARPLLGTVVEITVRASDTQSSTEAIDQGFQAIATVQRQMSYHDPESMLSRINSSAFRAPVAVDEKTFHVLKTAKDVHRISGGLFDPTIAPTLERTGFLPPSPGEPPATGYSFADVELLKGNRVRFRSAGLRLDLGGVAKGFGVDEAVGALRSAGIDSGLVNAGGDLRAFGTFPVGIRDPRAPGRTFTSFSLSNLALATSAHYFASRLKPRARKGPFVEPRRGAFWGDSLSVSVLVESAILADALTKVVMLDPMNALPILDRFSAAALVCTPNGDFFCSPNWHEKLQAAA